MRRVIREVGIFAFFFAAAAGLTWPLASHLRTAAPDLGDPILNTWILDWDCYALTHSPLHLFDAPIYHPSKYPLAYSENMLGIALFGLPFHLLGFAPLTIYNLLVLLGFAHAGYGAFVLARMITRAAIPSIVAGIFFAFTSFKFDHMSHIQILWSGWLPLILAALIAFAARPAIVRAALLGGAFLMNGLTNIHFLLFAAIAVAVSIAFIGLTQATFNWRFWTGSIGAIAVASALLVPILLPYRTISRLYGARRLPAEVQSGSATWDDWLRTTSRSRTYGHLQDPAFAHAERQLFPGMLAIALTVYAFLTAPRRTRTAGSGVPPPRWLRAIDIAIIVLAAIAWIGAVTAEYRLDIGGVRLLSVDNSAIPMVILVPLVVVRLAIRMPHALGGSDGRALSDVLRDSRFPPALWTASMWIILGILGSLGMNAFFHAYLYKHVEAFRAVRAAARWAILVYVGLVPWAASGAAELIARRRGWRRDATAGLLVIAAFIDVLPRVRWEQALVQHPPFYRWLARERVGPVLELPMHTDAGAEFQYLLQATLHHTTLLNGTSGWEPTAHERLRWRTEQNRMDETFTRTLERYGCRIVVIHSDLLGITKAGVLRWVAAETAAGRLAFLRRFDGGISGDYVLAVTRNLPEWPRYVDNSWDPAGFQQGESFQRLLRGEPTYTSSVFGRVESPGMYADVHGPLDLSGWALSQYGIDHVTVFVHGATVRFTADRHDRPDVAAMFPWYPKVPQPGFVLHVPRRPRGVPRDTDVQVEVVDSAGRTLRLPDIPLHWD